MGQGQCDKHPGCVIKWYNFHTECPLCLAESDLPLEIRKIREEHAQKYRYDSQREKDWIVSIDY